MPPSISGTPQRRQYTPNTASRAATRRSHHSASSSPPATAWPSTAAITGFESSMRVGPIGPSPHVELDAVAAALGHRLQVGARAERPAGARQHRRPPARRRRRSAGTRRPAPRAVGPSTALRTSGRSMVTTATGPSTSKSTLMTRASRRRPNPLCGRSRASGVENVHQAPLSGWRPAVSCRTLLPVGRAGTLTMPRTRGR